MISRGLQPVSPSLATWLLCLVSSLITRLGAFYQWGTGRSTEWREPEWFVRHHFCRRKALRGPPGKLGRFFPRLKRNGFLPSDLAAGALTRQPFSRRRFCMSIAVVRRDGLAHDVRRGQRDFVYLAH